VLEEKDDPLADRPNKPNQPDKPNIMKISRFEDLDCWQEATSLAIDIYKVTSEGDIATDFGLRYQIRRSAVSIASNIAEGKERETIAELIYKVFVYRQRFSG